MRHVVFNSKGGVGKSSIVCNLAAVSAAEGKRTLVVDLDPQANATHYLLGSRASEAKPNLTDFFDETLGLRLLTSDADTWVHTTPFANLSIIPSDLGLAELQPKLESRHKIYKLRKLLDRLDEFEVVFLDTPPALNFFTTSALISADDCLIPFDCDEFSRRALMQLLEAVDEIREDHNADLEVRGIVVNLFQLRARLPQQLVDQLLDENLPVLEPYITASVKMRESHEAHRPLVDLAPSHKLSQQFRELYATLAPEG
ncbi:MAG: AAA family ATPase [Nitrospirae bacterium]|nr:AAA family ATPase [Nitrospirota bacterium]